MHGYPRACEQRCKATPDNIEETPMALKIATIITRHDLCGIGGADWGGTRCVSPKVGERQKEEHRGKRVRPILVLPKECITWMGHPSLVLHVSTTLNVGVFHQGPLKLSGYNWECPLPVSSSTNLPFLECNFREVGLGLIIVDDLGTRLEVDLEKGNVKGSE